MMVIKIARKVSAVIQQVQLSVSEKLESAMIKIAKVKP